MTFFLADKKECVLGGRYGRLGEFHRYIQGEREDARQGILREILDAVRHDIPCLCGAVGGVVLATIDRWGLPCREFLCPECGLLRVSPRWDDATYGRIYAGPFWKLQSGSAAITRDRFDLSVERGRPFAETLTRFTSVHGKRVLELGCSYGAGLVRLAGAGAASLVGYDWDENILETGRGYTGFDLRRGGVDAALADHPAGVDIVVLRHVFEHILDPFGEGVKLRKLLAPGGLLFIEVPGVMNPEEWSPDPMGFFNAFHVYSYCLRTLSRVMERCGFMLVAGDEHLFSLWKPVDNPEVHKWEDRRAAERVLSFIGAMERRKRLRQLFPVRSWFLMQSLIGQK